MRNSINEAIASTVSDMLEADLKVSFTKKELDKLGVEVAPVSVSSEAIQSIRKTLGVSQSAFGCYLEVALENKEVIKEPSHLSKSKRINISIPISVLNKIDKYVASQHISRSSFFKESALGDKIMKEEYDLSPMKSRPNPYAQNSNFFPLWHFSLLDDRENRISEGKAVFSDILKAKKDWES